MTWMDFIKKKNFSSRQERLEAEERAGTEYDEAVRAAIRSRFSDEVCPFEYLPQNKKGLIPLYVKLSAVGSDRSRTVIFEKNLDSLGMESGGNGRFTRNVYGARLKPRVWYEIVVKTKQDSPVFFNVPIEFGMIFDPRMSVLKD